MSTVGLELLSFVNPDLTWTASKGRSTSRRSRRPGLKNSKMGHEQNKSPKHVESQGSESGKITGIARRFNDSMEHIPIKKRRFVFRSPSPPPQSPHKESGELENSGCVSDQQTTALPQKVEIDSSNLETSVPAGAYDSSIEGNNLRNIDEVCGRGDDFSGIEILAAAACIDMLDKPSANTMQSAIDVPITEEGQEKTQVTVEDSLPASHDVTCETSEGTKTSSVSRDDRLHWDLNTPMDEWDHPLDGTVVDSAMKLETTPVDFLVNKEHATMRTAKESTPQLSVGVKNTSEALDVTENVSSTELSQMEDCPTAKVEVNTGEELPESPHNDSDGSHLQVVDRVETIQDYRCGSTSSMNGGVKNEFIPSDINHVQVVDRVETVDHCLCLGLNDTKTSLSEGKSMAGVNDLQNVTKEGSVSAMKADNAEKREMSLSLEPKPVEANCDIHDSTDEVTKNSKKIMKSDERKNELQEVPFHPFQCYPIPPETQELALSNVSVSVDAAQDIPQFKEIKDHGEMPKVNEVETVVSSASDQPLEANPLDVKTGEPDSLQVAELEEQTTIHDSRCEDNVEPEKKNDLGCASSNLGHVFQPVETHPVGTENTSIELKDTCMSCYSSKSDDMGASTSVGDGKSAKSARGVETADESGFGVVKVDDNQDIAPNDLENICCEDSSDHVLQSHVSHEDGTQVVTTGLEGGYDSYLEDGELRESVEHCWVDNDGENRESEHVDYDSDNRDECEFTDAANGPIAEKVVAEVECEKQSSQLHEHLQCEDGPPAIDKHIEEDNSCPRQDSLLAEGDAGMDCLKEQPSTSNSIFTAQFNAMDNPEVVDMDLDDGRKPSIVSDDRKEDAHDCFADVEDVYRKGAGTKGSRRELQSQVEGPSSSDRRDAHAAPRSRYGNFNRSYYRDERHIGVDESLGRGRSLQIDYGGRMGSRYWNHGLRSVVANPATEGDDEKFFGPSDDTSLGAHRQGMFPTSRGGYAHLVRKGSPAGRAEDYGVGFVKVRDNSESGQRNRYDRHISGMNRGLREGYQRHIYDAPNSSSSMPNHFIKRERSFSPGGSRMDPHPPRSHRRSRSRSRTHSPDSRPDGRMGRMRMQYQTADYFRERRSPLKAFCQGQRFESNSGRLRSENCLRPVTRPVRFLDVPPSSRAHEYENDDDFKRKTYIPRSHRRSRSRSRSCSPEFRSEPRMGTMRLPYLPTNHTGDHMTDRRSPPRIFRPGKRFDTMGSASRLRSDDYMRSIVRPVRFQETAQPSRGNEYEGDDYRRKSRTIFDRIHPTRNYDMEGDGRRFGYDAEDSAATHSFRRGDVYIRGADRRPVDLRGAREERSNIRYNSDRIYSTGPKPFGNREYSDDTLPRHLRPE